MLYAARVYRHMAVVEPSHVDDECWWQKCLESQACMVQEPISSKVDGPDIFVTHKSQKVSGHDLPSPVAFTASDDKYCLSFVYAIADSMTNLSSRLQ